MIAFQLKGKHLSLNLADLLLCKFFEQKTNKENGGIMEETISLKELFTTLKRRIFWIISMMILALTIGGLASYYFLTPIYQASTHSSTL